MIHFVFSEQDPRYLFLKFDTPDDELWLASNKKHKNGSPDKSWGLLRLAYVLSHTDSTDSTDF